MSWVLFNLASEQQFAVQRYEVNVIVEVQFIVRFWVASGND
jgi:hypothetical protein